jgi:acyl carrier protein
MSQRDVRSTVLEALSSVAPEADTASLEADVPFRDQLDIDSMDFLNFLIKLSEELGVEVPEKDATQLGSLDECVVYLEAALAARE